MILKVKLNSDNRAAGESESVCVWYGCVCSQLRQLGSPNQIVNDSDSKLSEFVVDYDTNLIPTQIRFQQQIWMDDQYFDIIPICFQLKWISFDVILIFKLKLDLKWSIKR